MQIKKEKTVAITGYRASKMRPKYNDVNHINVVITETYLAIKELYKQGYTTYLTGCCEGFDLIAAEAVLKLKEEHSDIRLVAVIPFKGQDKDWCAKDRLTYEHVIRYADDRIILAEKFIDNQQYLERNNYLLENSSCVICYYDGQRGGTMYTVNRAKKTKMPITNICEMMADYINNTSPAKRALQHYHYVDGFRYCKEGIVMDYTNEYPIIVPFENIEKVENTAGKLHLYLRNGQTIVVSLFSDDCKILLPPKEESTLSDKVSDCINKIKGIF